MTAIAEIAQKLSKLVPLLDSDKDGEVLAAVGAIRRTLKTAGMDLHDLARTLCQDDAAPLEPPPAHSWQRRHTGPFKESCSRWSWQKQTEALRDIMHNSNGLTDWETEFVTSAFKQLCRYHRPLTPKQVKVVDGIRDKLFGVN